VEQGDQDGLKTTGSTGLRYLPVEARLAAISPTSLECDMQDIGAWLLVKPAPGMVGMAPASP
jgi:hypothetical protein